MDLYLRKGLRNELLPEDEEAAEALRKIKHGTIVKCTVRRERNTDQHRLYWALCRLVAMNHPELTNAEMVHQAIKLLAGHCDLLQLDGGEVVKVPRSISFSSMDQQEFDVFMQRAKQAVVEHLLPGVGLREIQEELLRMTT